MKFTGFSTVPALFGYITLIVLVVNPAVVLVSAGAPPTNSTIVPAGLFPPSNATKYSGVTGLNEPPPRTNLDDNG